jgi:small nuclear ribonucleoprotein (snRNP)-like protein
MEAQQQSRPGQMAFRLGLVALGLLLVAAQMVQGWAAWRREVASSLPGGAQLGSLVSVTLVNGQVYYGNLASFDAHHIGIDDVYYVQTTVDASTNQRNNRLVSRKKADWHAPQRMTVLADKVVIVELVGLESQLVQLIAQDKQLAPNKPP